MSADPPIASPFTYTVDLTRVLYATILGLVALGAAYFGAFEAKRNAPVAQPSVPSLIPPPLSCLCGTTKATRPFSLVCPYCRNTLSVQPSATTGEPTGVVAKQAK